jgi:uncharacterized membrane protein
VKAALRGLTHRFWAVPLLFAVAAAVLALGVTAIDDSLDTSLRLPFLFAGGPEGARALLSAIITSMISFTGLVFSITIVVLQLTSSQFSPRVLRSFLEDRFNQVALGVFVATFVYALMVLRGVRGTAQVDSFVPQIAVTVAFVLVLASVLVFLAYIHHIAQSIRAATVIASIADDTRALIEVRVPADSRPGPVLPLPNGPSRTIAADRPGVLQRVDDRALGDAADSQGVSIELLRAVGEFVAKGAPLALVHGEASFDDGRLHAAVHVGRERSMDEDIGFGLRQLVDIAERTLSPGINDPTTACRLLTSCMTSFGCSPPVRCRRGNAPRRMDASSCQCRSRSSPTTSNSRSTRSPIGAGQHPHTASRSDCAARSRGCRSTRTPDSGAGSHRAPPRGAAGAGSGRAFTVRHRTSLTPPNDRSRLWPAGATGVETLASDGPRHGDARRDPAR